MNSQVWRTAKVYDLTGKLIGCVRVPRDPIQPRIIFYGNRYFALATPHNYYNETKCYLVPLENMYAPAEAAPAPAPGTGKA